VGDSRTYGLYADDFLALTEDHSYIADMLKRGELSEEEAAVHPNRNMLTNALGIWDSVRIDINKIKNDYKALLICSDGLHGYVSEAIIREILESKRSVEDKVRMLIDKALLAGGYDNVSVIIVEQAGDLHE
ncbi:serine/threonine-protein phosphatase, partial [[Clostridium] innocuum]|nr:serine/threonine-protein phosphatase [[Clostridium] innocuum]